MNKYYTGIGSRDVKDNDILDKVNIIVEKLVKKSFILRSGGANGMDTIFENAQDKFYGDKEIYLPWKNFNNNKSSLFNISDDAFKMAKNFHPYFESCSYGAKKLHSRNCYQVLGLYLNYPSELVVYWKNPNKSSGTDQALRIAKFYSIPTFNIFINNEYESCLKFIDSL